MNTAFRFWELAFFRAYATLRAEINRNILGLLWWIIEPAMYLGAFVLIFSTGFRVGDQHYVVHLLIGLTSWKWFSSCLVMGVHSISGNRGLIENTNVNKMIFPLSMVISNTIKYLFLFFIMIIIIILLGTPITTLWLYLIPLTIVNFVFILSIAIIVSSVVPFITDLGILINNTIILLFFLSGIFFQIDTIGNSTIKYVLYLNPVALFIKYTRLVILGTGTPGVYGSIYLIFISVLLLLFSILLVNYMGKKYAKYL